MLTSIVARLYDWITYCFVIIYSLSDIYYCRKIQEQFKVGDDIIFESYMLDFYLNGWDLPALFEGKCSGRILDFKYGNILIIYTHPVARNVIEREINAKLFYAAYEEEMTKISDDLSKL